MFLNCHSYHSLRYGTISTDDLVRQAVTAGAEAIALTDINTAIGIYDFMKAALKEKIRPVVGLEFRLDNGLLYIALAKNALGVAQMCRLRTEHNLGQKPLAELSPPLPDCFVIYPLSRFPADLAENEFIGIRPHELPRLHRTELRALVHKMVVLHPVTVSSKKEHNLHRILRAIDNNVVLSKLPESDICRPDEKMMSPDELRELYRDFPAILSNTDRLIGECNFSFDFTLSRNKRFYTNSRYSDLLLLERLAKEGLERRYGKNNKKAEERMKQELKVIDELGFSGYFLINWDIIRYSNSRSFMHIGRGSGANSIVSYCLGITDICPLELNLYFERFLNPARTSPPDFDIDWSWKERDEILDYIFKRFDTRHTAFTGTIAEFKYRSIIREVGKVFGLPKEEMDALVNEDPGTHEKNSVVKYVHEYGRMLEKYPNQRSMHSCGILISEQPLTDYMVLELPPKGFPTATVDMHIAEDIGFDKFDILSQRGLGHIRDCVDIIEANRGEVVNIRDVNLCKDEKRCNEYLKNGKTIGCFYVESPAMRGLLRRLQCDSYLVLVAASSVIRPGVAQSGMMREYVFRHNNPGKFEYFHPVFEEQLGETYGVMVYQEDVIKIAHHFAGLDLSDADILRRAMSGKTRSRAEFEGVRQRFFDNCKLKGYSEQLSAEVYRQIESFAGYSFCKAHSASYAVESYQSLYLKAYYPIEFMVAVINNFGGFYRTEVYFHEARMAGATLCNPCVNKSEYLTTVYGKEVFAGFIHLHNLDEKTAKIIPEERKANGAYTSLEDFVQRVPVGIEMLSILIFAGAFRFTGRQKNELILRARMLLGTKKVAPAMLLLREPPREYKLPQLQRSPFEDAFDEIELLGFPLSCSPFDLLETKYRGDVKVKDMLSFGGKRVRMLGYLICRKHVPTSQGMMNFGTWVDDEGEYFDSTHFAKCLEEFPFSGGGCYLLLGKIDVDFSFPTLTVEKMARLPFVPDPRYEDDKDMRYRAHRQLREDVSATHRAPYPSEAEIGLPRYKMQ